MTTSPARRERPLSATQAATRLRLIDAAASLATERGYDGFGMREVAQAAGVVPATVYSYYRSKDDLLVDLLVERDVASAAAQRRRGAANDPVGRTIDGFGRIVSAYERSPRLYQAVFRAYLGRIDSTDEDPMALWAGRSWLNEALGEDSGLAPVTLEVLAHQVLASLVSLVAGAPPDQVRERFGRAVVALCAPPSHR